MPFVYIVNSTGKSKIHGFGIFAKLPHKAGDMVSVFLFSVIFTIVSVLQENVLTLFVDSGYRIYR